MLVIILKEEIWIKKKKISTVLLLLHISHFQYSELLTQ